MDTTDGAAKGIVLINTHMHRPIYRTFVLSVLVIYTYNLIGVRNFAGTSANPKQKHCVCAHHHKIRFVLVKVPS